MSDSLPVTASALRAGLLVGGRYELERALGRGGMGEVWSARDGAAGGVVALKFVLAADGRPPPVEVRGRQLREARAAQRVRHPRVVALLDAFDEPGRGPVLVMQYLEGEPLAARLEREGALPAGAVAGLGVDLCEGLAAAHAAGVVHRDLKPSNVLLARSADGAERPCIVDFGVAKLLPTTLDEASSTAGGFVGTPAYMAPEQLFGEADVDHRADVWALGVVLFVAATGRSPTGGASFGEVLKNVLSRPVPRARSLAPALPAGFDELLARMLTRDRDARPSLAEVAASLAPLAGRAAPALPVPRRAPARPPAADGAAVDSAGGADTMTNDSRATSPPPVVAGSSAAGGAAESAGAPEGAAVDGVRASRGAGAAAARLAAFGLAAVGAVALFVGGPAASRKVGAAFGPSSRSVAVVAPPDDLSPDAAVARAVARALASRWASSTEARVLPPEASAGVAAARALGRGEASAARPAAEALGVEAVVVVRPAARGAAGAELARLEAYAAPDGFRGGAAFAVGGGGAAPELLGAARWVRGRLGLPEARPGDAALAAQGLPTSPAELARAWRAERALRAGEMAAARRELDGPAGPAAEAPALALARAELAASEGYEGRSRASAEAALAGAAGLAHDERLALEARAYQLLSDFERAVGAQRALWAARPEAPEHGRRLAEMLVDAGRYVEALDALGRLGADVPSDDEGRLGVLAGESLVRTGERERGAAELEAALGRAERAGALAVAARARLGLGEYFAGADLPLAREHAERARAIYARLGDAAGVVRAELSAAATAYQRERYDEALEAGARARAALPAGELTSAEASVRRLEAMVAKRQGRVAEAMRLAADALDAARAGGNRRVLSVCLNLLAGLALDNGERDRALPLFLEAAAVAREGGHKGAAAIALQNLALAHLRTGDLWRAREAAAESVSLYRALRDRYDVAWALDALGLVEIAAGRPADARALFEEALAVREANGLAGGQSRQNVAEALRNEGRLAEAVAACQRAVDELSARKSAAQEVNALVLLADLLVEAGELARARAAVERALSLGDERLHRTARSYLPPVLARLEFAEGDARAPERLERALREGDVAEEERPWARLALGQLWLRAGRRERGRALLTEVVAGARRSGAGELQRRAERALDGAL